MRRKVETAGRNTMNATEWHGAIEWHGDPLLPYIPLALIQHVCARTADYCIHLHERLVMRPLHRSARM